tara:strand:+ start:1965 stop:2876 length:912 start_codon:yes stop_codon:yes gene_type:complete
MTLSIKKKCPNNDCTGDIDIKYQTNTDNIDNINFACTTNTYTKPTVLMCKKCGILFSELIYKFGGNQFEKNYQEIEDTKYLSQIKYKRIYFENFCKKVGNELGDNLSVLEIGSYYGVLGSIIKDKVGKYSGLELSKHGSNFAVKNFNLNIYNETIEEHLIRGIKYDLIIMADVIEHFYDPFKVFNQISSILKKNGKIILTTFNIDSFYCKLTKLNYHWIIPYHLVFFSNKTLEDLGKTNNLSLYKIENDPRYVSVGYLLEKLNLIFPKIGFIFRLINKLKFIKNISIKVNLGDLNIYYFIKDN